MLDLSERRVRQLKDQGVIHEYAGKPGLYELIPTVHAYINYLRNRNPDGAENIDYNTERAKLVQAKRKNEEYDLRVRERDLHESADIELAMSAMLMSFRSRLLSVPAKLAPVLAKKTDKAECSAILKHAMDDALSELADFNAICGERNNDGATDDSQPHA